MNNSSDNDHLRYNIIIFLKVDNDKDTICNNLSEIKMKIS